MSILNSKVEIGTSVNLTVAKKGGSDYYKNGKVIAQTDKAIFVRFEEEKVQCWIPKRITNPDKSGNGLYSKAVMWQAWARVKVEPISETIPTEEAE